VAPNHGAIFFFEKKIMAHSTGNSEARSGEPAATCAARALPPARM